MQRQAASPTPVAVPVSPRPTVQSSASRDSHRDSLLDAGQASSGDSPSDRDFQEETLSSQSQSAQDTDNPLQFLPSALRHPQVSHSTQASPSSRTRSRGGFLEPPLSASPKKRRASTTVRSPSKKPSKALSAVTDDDEITPMPASTESAGAVVRPLVHQHSSSRLLPALVRARGQSQSPVITRSHCAYHKVRIIHGDDAFTFLAPQCTLSDRELLEELDAEDLGPADPTEPTVQLEDQFPSVENDALVAKARRLVGPELVEEGIALVSTGRDNDEIGGSDGREPTSAVKARLSLASASAPSTPPPRVRKRRQPEASPSTESPLSTGQTSLAKPAQPESPASATRKRKLQLTGAATESGLTDGLPEDGNPSKKSKWWFW